LTFKSRSKLLFTMKY